MDYSFFNLYHHGFVRVAVGIPDVRVANPVFNVKETIQLLKQAAEQQAVLMLFPELGLTAYSCEDLFQQQACWIVLSRRSKLCLMKQKLFLSSRL